MHGLQAMAQEEQQWQPVRNSSPREITLAEVIPQTAQYYCLVDASWKNQTEPSGIGWSLYSIQGIQILQGSSSVQPTNTAFEAEALAMRMATQQLRALRFTNVALFSDCKRVIDEIKQGMNMETLSNVCITEAHSMIQDIYSLSKEQDFTFHYISRIWLHSVDERAKLAREHNQNYVITWLSS